MSGVAAKRITFIDPLMSFYRIDLLARRFNISFGSECTVKVYKEWCKLEK